MLVKPRTTWSWWVPTHPNWLATFSFNVCKIRISALHGHFSLIFPILTTAYFLSIKSRQTVGDAVNAFVCSLKDIVVNKNINKGHFSLSSKLWEMLSSSGVLVVFNYIVLGLSAFPWLTYLRLTLCSHLIISGCFSTFFCPCKVHIKSLDYNNFVFRTAEFSMLGLKFFYGRDKLRWQSSEV